MELEWLTSRANEIVSALKSQAFSKFYLKLLVNRFFIVNYSVFDRKCYYVGCFCRRFAAFASRKQRERTGWSSGVLVTYSVSFLTKPVQQFSC